MANKYVNTPWGIIERKAYMGYKDRTWCGQDACQNECGRQFTAKEREAAIKWWGADDFPIMVAEFCDANGKLKPEAYVN